MKLLFTIISACSFLFIVNNAAAQPTLAYTPVISTGLSSPMQLVHAGDGSNRIFIVQKGGSILVYDKAYTLLGTFLTITGIQSAGERGLLSMAFHPQYASNGIFYVYYTNGNGDLELARYKVTGNPVTNNTADEASGVILKTIIHQPNTNHNGGELHFGNDGMLYLSTGDGGGGGDVPNNAQTTSSLLGKMLRFNVTTDDTPPYYTIPANNPYGNEVYSFGLRNPFRWSFDRATYDMWIGDVGQDSYEEINHTRPDSSRNVNYGWHCYEGTNQYDLTGCNSPIEYTNPVYFYATPNPSGSVTGGTVYRGNTYIAMRGYYIATDFFTGIIYKIKYDSVTHLSTTTEQPSLNIATIADFGETEDGELYAVSLGNVVYRISSDGPIGYTFTGNGNWDVAANWSNNSIPPATLPAGAEIIIDPVANGECVLNVTQNVSAGAKFNVKTNKKFRVTGDLNLQ